MQPEDLSNRRKDTDVKEIISRQKKFKKRYNVEENWEWWKNYANLRSKK